MDGPSITQVFDSIIQLIRSVDFQFNEKEVIGKQSHPPPFLARPNHLISTRVQISLHRTLPLENAASCKQQSMQLGTIRASLTQLISRSCFRSLPILSGFSLSLIVYHLLLIFHSFDHFFFFRIETN